MIGGVCMDDRELFVREIEIEAKGLARKCKIDADRVKYIFSRLVDIGWYAPKFPKETALDIALQYREPEQALSIFEDEDLTRLATRVSAVEYLQSSFTPFYTLKELADLINKFISHLYQNRDHLIKTGFPETSFESSIWLDVRLNKLYYTKLPLIDPITKGCLENRVDISLITRSVKNSTTVTKNIDGNLKFHYIWAKDTIPEGQMINLGPDTGTLIMGSGNLWGKEGPFFGDESPVEICDYDKAAPISGLKNNDAENIVNLRDSVFELKVEILQRLQKALYSGSGENLLEDCIGLILKNLTLEEINFLLYVDQFYAKKVAGGIISFSPNYGGFVYHSAGISDLIEVIGYCQKEIEIGTMDETKKAVLEIPLDTLPESYYLSIGEAWRNDLDFTLYLFSKLESREDKYWGKYIEQVNKRIEGSEQFNNDPVNAQLLEKLSQLEPLLDNFKEWHSKQSASETFPKTDSTEKELKPKIPDYAFIKKGDFWQIAYNGIDTLLKDTTGLNYIAELIKNPKQGISVMFLLSEMDSNYSPAATGRFKKMKREELEEQGIGNVGGDGTQKTADALTEKEFKEVINDLNAELQEAEDNLDSYRIEEIKDKKEEFLEWASREYGITEDHHTSRVIEGPDEKARKAVSMAIKRAIDNIGEEIPDLALHLKHFIQKGKTCTYYPDREIPWKIK